ncbi:MAG: hypothetical protein JEZ00_09635 [Anaerolineaceae bacterium]|nr:hypothetical protein [Anaerolineaceae bacterium]
MKRKIAIYFLGFCLILDACSFSIGESLDEKSFVENVFMQNEQTNVNQNAQSEDEFDDYNETCLGLFNDFSYQVVDDYTDYIDRGDVYPLVPWTLVFELPLGTINTLIPEEYSNTKNEIWIGRYHTDLGISPLDGEAYDILIYDVEENSSTIVSNMIGSTGAWVSNFLFSPDGTVWGTTKWSKYKDYPFESIPILSIYNQYTHQFELDENSYHIPIALVNDDSWDWPEFLIGDEGEIWFFIANDGIYNYLPNEGSTTRKIDLPDGKPFNVLYGNNGKIYFFLWPDFNEGSRNIYEYEPKENLLSIFSTIDDGSYGGSNIIMDNSNNIWLGTISILDSMGNQTILHPQYEKDLEKRMQRDSEYWSPPTVLLESSNGYLWFSKSRYIDKGTAWYNPKTDQGCWFTTFSGNIYEDLNRQMWFLADNKLYKYALEQ